MSTRLKHETVSGPKGEVLEVSWMPGNRVRLDFKKCGKCVVTKIFPKEVTHIEVSYGTETSEPYRRTTAYVVPGGG